LFAQRELGGEYFGISPNLYNIANLRKFISFNNYQVGPEEGAGALGPFNCHDLHT